MEINKEELREIANQLKIELKDEELDKIGGSIAKITDKLNEIFSEDTTEYEILTTSAEQKHDLTAKQDENFKKVDFTKVNNFDGQHVKITKEDKIDEE